MVSNITIDDVTGELTINGSLDREAVSELSLMVDCHLHRDGATESVTASRRVTIAVRDVDDNGPFITNRFLGAEEHMEETQVELNSLAQVSMMVT